jgi:hypothetical protein
VDAYLIQTDFSDPPPPALPPRPANLPQPGDSDGPGAAAAAGGSPSAQPRTAGATPDGAGSAVMPSYERFRQGARAVLGPQLFP